MKNITLSVDEKVLETVRRYAAGQNSSVNALVREYLARVPACEERGASARRRLLELSRESTSTIGDEPWSRNEMHKRSIESTRIINPFD